jgi:hypothetical protein
VKGVVKKALGPYFARSKTPKEAQKIIYDGVCKGIECRYGIEPFIIRSPYRLNLLDSHSKKIIEKDIEGDDLVEVFNAALNTFPGNKYGLRLPDGFQFKGI